MSLSAKRLPRIWQKIDAMSILQIAVVSCGLLAIVLAINVYGSRAPRL